MRKIFIVLVLGLVSIICFGQNIGTGTATATETVEFADNSESEIVKLMNNGSTLTKKEFFDLPEVKGVSFEVIIITDMVKGNKYGGLRLITKYTAPYLSNTYIGTLDYSEIDDCINSMNVIKNDILPTTPSVYTEVRYKTKDYVEMGALFSPNNSWALIQAPSTGKWFVYISTKSYLNNSTAIIPAKQIDAIISNLQESKRIIEEQTGR